MLRGLVCVILWYWLVISNATGMEDPLTSERFFLRRYGLSIQFCLNRWQTIRWTALLGWVDSVEMM